MGVPRLGSRLHEGALRNTAGPWRLGGGGVSEAPDIQSFQPDGIMGSIPSKLLSSVGPVESLLRVSQGRPHSTPGSGFLDISCVPELPLHRGTKFQRPGCGGSLAHLRVRGLLNAWPATASHPLGYKSSADRPGPKERSRGHFLGMPPPPVASLPHCLSPPPPQTP